mmetsp:Transcript_19287/g.34877  ORF Transcript_19287/g.34877 Transcript_19287/m.34877 type:complete len:255 (+) Transcript_19287:918-1682(+)
MDLTITLRWIPPSWREVGAAREDWEVEEEEVRWCRARRPRPRSRSRQSSRQTRDNGGIPPLPAACHRHRRCPLTVHHHRCPLMTRHRHRCLRTVRLHPWSPTVRRRPCHPSALCPRPPRMRCVRLFPRNRRRRATCRSSPPASNPPPNLLHPAQRRTTHCSSASPPNRSRRTSNPLKNLQSSHLPSSRESALRFSRGFKRTSTGGSSPPLSTLLNWVWTTISTSSRNLWILAQSRRSSTVVLTTPSTTSALTSD